MQHPRHLIVFCLLLSSLFHKESAFSSCGSGCGCQYGPLLESTVRVAAYGGFVPTYFSHKSGNLYLNSDGICGIIGSGQSFNFHEQSHIPWTIGLDIGYVSTQYAELFFGVSYVKSLGKDHHFDLDGFRAKFRFKSYSDVGVWAGMRYYFVGADMCGGCYFDPFFGFKMGIKFYNKVKADYTAKDLGFFHEDLTYYQKEALPALGVQLGFAFNFFDCVDMVFMGEAIYAGPFRNNNKVFLGGDAGEIQAISVGETGPIWSFPVTLGLVISL